VTDKKYEYAIHGRFSVQSLCRLILSGDKVQKRRGDIMNLRDNGTQGMGKALVPGMVAWLLLALCSAAGQAQESAPSGAEAAAVENGKKVYDSAGCGRCHGRSGQGGGEGPSLAPDPMPLPDFIKYVRNPTGEMPPYKAAALKDSDLADIHAFLKTITK
jgi:mono/diheme cytochrome c family protein